MPHHRHESLWHHVLFTQRRRGFKQHPSTARSGCLITATKVYVILWDVARRLALNLNVSQVYDDPLPILAILTLASSLYLCFPFVVPSPRPFSPSDSCYPVVSTLVPDFTEM